MKSFAILAALFAVPFLSIGAQAQESSLPLFGSVPSQSQSKITAKQPTTSINSAADSAGFIQSDFYQLPAADKGLVEVSYMSYSGALSSSVQAEDGTPRNAQTDRSATGYSFSYLYGISDSLAFGLDAGFIKSTTTEVDGTSSTANGLRDFGASIVARSPYETFDLVYGASLAGSPEITSTSTSRMRGSNFSGGIALSPFIGFDGKVGISTIGAKFTTNFATNRNSDSRFGLNSGSRFNFESIAFFEFPVYRPVLMGVALSFLGDDASFADSQSRIYGGQVYASAKILDDTSIRVSLEGLSKEASAGNMSATQITAALRKSL